MTKKPNIEIYALHLSKEKLLKSPKAERNLFFLLGHIANDLIILNRLFLIAANSTQKRSDNFIKRYNSAQALLIGKIITSKLHEGWELIRKLYFSKEISEKYNPILPRAGHEALDYLKKYFGKANLVSSVRNNFGFHYPAGKVTGTLESISNDEELVLYLSASSNSLYYACDLIPNYEMINSIGEADLQKSYERLIDETSKCFGKLNDFIQNYMVSFITENDIAPQSPVRKPTYVYKTAIRLKNFKLPSVFDDRGLPSRSD